ncbi:SUMF1/EgtB/PvdO family nonheme iron enzyme [Burkholderiaceae bacterium FT117]|uniref:selenoneine synthase SenA n=1 Tax=Zeimonas sediminis TaxID=2944268 RepID=UPI002342D244|nr:selenoneine synthase SenA [Zeimonas sediminis]MCM5569578.1 SUMF1/EgtB/PvdO family nonheme iron enzyme [Zeimonas sediminis]
MTGIDARRCGPAELAVLLARTRARLLALVDDLDDGQWQVPFGNGLNPFAWELAHVAWFAEWWTLRGPHRPDASGRLRASRPGRHAGADDLLDSSRLPHAERWRVALPAPARVREMLAGQLADTLDALSRLAADDEALYFHRLALMHEAMHCEAMAWMRAALAYPAPAGPGLPVLGDAREPVRVSGAALRMGVPAGEPGFAFDNERAGRVVVLDDFDIDPAPVSAGRFLEFVEAGGYRDPRWWPGEAGRWLAAHGLAHPARWRRQGAEGWQVRWFDRWLPLDPALPAIHLSAWEAEAWCRWAGRRLPGAAQWQLAASRGVLHWGDSVWEWSADAFEPYPGFEPGPYRDYSAPWFGDHRELRGGAFATEPPIRDLRYRNYFTPGRTDVFAGFRTVSATVDRSGTTQGQPSRSQMRA